MGGSQSIQKINFEDIQFVLKNKNSGILINTLREEEQECLIINTVNIHKEVELINHCLKNGKNQYNPASGLNEDELKTVLSIVNGLPKYNQ
jgi:hypothetical protein